MKNLNAVYSSLGRRRRYEVWFLRLGLADGSGAWWFRYLLLNPGRGGCSRSRLGMPVQVWATWFPCRGKPQTFIQGFPLDQLDLSQPGAEPFHFGVRGCGIEHDSCFGVIDDHGHRVAWRLRYRSNFGCTLSDKGWIGFSRTPHSDAVFSGEVSLDGHTCSGDPLAQGVQGHNCGYRHRNQWTWTHAYFADTGHGASALEALTYEMPMGLRFRSAVLWHRGRAFRFGNFLEARRERDKMQWEFECRSADGARLTVAVDGAGETLHRLPYLKTDCSGIFEVANNSWSRARVLFRSRDATEELTTGDGAVLEMAG